MMQMNGDIQGNGATSQEDAEMEEGIKNIVVCKAKINIVIDN